RGHPGSGIARRALRVASVGRARPRAGARAPWARTVPRPRATSRRGNGGRSVRSPGSRRRARLERDGDLQGRRRELCAGEAGGRTTVMRMRVRMVAHILVVGLLLAALPAAAYTTRDMLGRDVTLAAPPRRIVSLVPSVTEILYALNAESL